MNDALRRARKAEANARYRAAHREQEQEYKARYRAEHPEQAREWEARYRAAHRSAKAEYDAQYRAEHRERLQTQRTRYQTANRDAILARQRRYTSEPSNRMRRLVNNARLRARTMGLDFDPGLLDVLTASPPSLCACCGVPLDYDAGRGRNNRDASPSLDRVDNMRGYTLNNVAVICWRCNGIKGFASPAELETVVAYVKRHQGEWA